MAQRWLLTFVVSTLMLLAGCQTSPRSHQATAPGTASTYKARLEHTIPGRAQVDARSVAKRHQRGVVASANFNIPILEFHDVTIIPADPYAISPAQLDAEMAYLKSHGFRTVTLDDVYEAIHHRLALRPRSIVLTFDDGYESNFTSATPILRKYGFVATEFAVSGFINRPGFLSSQQLKAMETSGIWRIESHTVTHPDLAKLHSAQLWTEVSQSKASLSRLVGAPVNYFCYPFGDVNDDVLRDVRRAGYRLAVCSRQGYANPALDGIYLLNRIAIHQGLPTDEFARMLSPSFKS